MTQRKYRHSFKRRIAVALAMTLSCTAFLVTQSAIARSGMPMPGSTSGNIQFPGSAQPNESDNLLLNGAFEQGVDFLSISQATAFNFFGRLNYKVDTEELDFNRKILLGVGVRLRHSFSDSFVMSVGAKYEYDKRFVVERHLEGTQLFANWFNYWDVSNSHRDTDGRPGPLGYPGLTWGEIRYPGSQDPIEENTKVLEGYVEQGVDWADWGRWGTFNFYGNLDYIADTEEIEWNNMYALGAGIKFKKRIGNNLLLQYGIEATREHYWVSDQTLDAAFVYFNWSAWWDSRVAWRDAYDLHKVRRARGI